MPDIDLAIQKYRESREIADKEILNGFMNAYDKHTAAIKNYYTGKESDESTRILMVRERDRQESFDDLKRSLVYNTECAVKSYSDNLKKAFGAIGPNT
jgi:hypothetical protein